MTLPETGLLRCLSALLLACLATATNAGEQPERRSWHVGAGMVVLDQPYVGVDTETFGFPVIVYLGERLQVLGSRAQYLLVGNERFSLNAVTSIRLGGFDPDDSEALQGMKERDESLDAGFAASFHGAWGSLELDVLADVLDRYAGQEARLSYSYELGNHRVSVTPFAGLHWQSANLADYYYGVRQEEAVARRPAYEVPAATSPFAGIGVRYQFTPRWGLFGAFEWQKLDHAVTASPIVDDDRTRVLFVTLNYAL